jgi:tol-pal system protein YbgF
MKHIPKTLLSLALASAFVFSAAEVSAQSGRLSLSERIAKLESQTQGQGGQSMVDLLNRISELQSEVQSLRGLVESQAFEIEELKKRSRDQYVDLDSRLARIESGGAARTPTTMGTVPGTPIQPGQTQQLPVQPTEPGQLMMEPGNAARPPLPMDSTGLPATQNPMDNRLPTEPPMDALPASGAQVPTNPVSALPTQANDEQASYDTAFAALREGRYAESARRFSGFLTQFPNGDLADNATYWLGESYYVTQNYRIALDTFKSLLDRFPQSAKAADALLKLGYCHYELHEWNEAEGALNQVVQRYPDTTVARLAQGRLRALRLEGRTP